MRRQGRQSALQLLYQMDMHGFTEPKLRLNETRINQAIADFWDSFSLNDAEERAFAERLVRGVLQQLNDIDETITQVSRRWRLARMTRVDRNLLRLSTFEIVHCPDIPRAASINEAVEIAKQFGGSESAAFINGVLDQMGKDADAAAETEALAAAVAAEPSAQ